MNERQPIPLYEWKNSHSPADADLIVIAERELGAFISAVTELFGPEQARLAAEDWVDELELMDALTGPTRRDWGSITVAASARLASRLNTDVDRAPARSVLLCSARRLPFSRYRMGDSPADAALLAGCAFWRIRRSACVAFLAHVGLHPIRCATRDFGFCRRVGYAARHDRRLVGESYSGRRSWLMNNKARGFFGERPLQQFEVDPQVLRRCTRRDVLLFGAGAAAALTGAGSLLPQDTLTRLGLRRNMNSAGKEEWLLNGALRIDDDVAEALYSPHRTVPTYTKSQITPLKNNYNGATPDPGYIPGWRLTLDGLASGVSVALDIRSLVTRFSIREQITRLVCVEGWSAIAWWAGLRFDDLIRAYPPMSQAKSARVESSVNLDVSGNPDPYFMSLDLATARHPQTLLATHFNDQPLTVDHGGAGCAGAACKSGRPSRRAVHSSVSQRAQCPNHDPYQRPADSHERASGLRGWSDQSYVMGPDRREISMAERTFRRSGSPNEPHRSRAATR
jgi:DMSO/TMAO reductase YedYZ molybdopterin-dependent catalytic subunit